VPLWPDNIVHDVNLHAWREAMVAARRSGKLLSPISLALIFGLGAFLIGAAMEVILHYQPVSAWLLVADDVFFGVLAGILVFRYEARRQRYLKQQVEIIAEMNHHVRNALQVILYSAESQSDTKMAAMLRDSSQRIDWALREILGTHQSEA
jgi:signal transduction histidine kinase